MALLHVNEYIVDAERREDKYHLVVGIRRDKAQRPNDFEPGEFRGEFYLQFAPPIQNWIAKPISLMPVTAMF